MAKKQIQLRCPACDSVQLSKVLVKGGATWYECEECYSIFTDATPPQVAGGSGAEERNIPGANSTRLLRFTEALRDGATLRLLDYGCGRGQFVDYAHEQGIEAEGYDPNNPAFATLPTGVFDGVLMVEVVEHLSQPIEALTAIAGVMGEGSILMVESSYRDDQSVSDLMDWEYVDTGIGHVTIYTAQGIATVMRRAGLELVRWLNQNVSLWRLAPDQNEIPVSLSAEEVKEFIAAALGGDGEGDE